MLGGPTGSVLTQGMALIVRTSSFRAERFASAAARWVLR